MRRVSIGEQGSCSQGAVDLEPLQWHRSTAIVVQGGAERGTYVLPTVLDSGAGISMVREAGLRHLQQHFQGLQVVHPCGVEPHYRWPTAGDFQSPRGQAC